MLSSLDELAAPIGTAAFLDALHRRVLTFRPGRGHAGLADQLGWGALSAAIEAGTIPAERVRVTHRERPVHSILYMQKGKVSLSMLDSLLQRGASVLAEPLDTCIPALGNLCRDIGTRLKEQARAAAVVTTGSGGAVALHFDPYDLVVLQIEGSKRWTIHEMPVVDAVEGMPKQAPPTDAPTFDEIVRPGDFLFVPAGYWHHCENGPGMSVHVGIGIRPPAAWHALETLLPKLLADPLYRKPVSRLDPDALLAHEAAVKDRLIETIRRSSLSELLRERIGSKQPQ